MDLEVGGSNPSPRTRKRRFGVTWRQKLGKTECPYAERWILTVFGYSLRLHHFIRSDDARANHDHPWWFVTLILKGAYYDIVEGAMPGHPPRRPEHMTPGTIRFRPAHHRHTVVVDYEANPGGVWTLVFTGRHVRTWGFWPRRIDGVIRFKKANKYFLEHGHHPCDQP